MSSEERLVYRDEIFVNFRNGTRRWVHVKLFALPDDADDRELLGLLLRHARYRDSYAGTGDVDMETIHGPYLLSALTPDAFEPVGPVEAETLVRTWAGSAGRVPEAAESELERSVCPLIRNAASRYRLMDLRPWAEHDWGWVVGSLGGFHELVLVDRAKGVLALMVASDD